MGRPPPNGPIPPLQFFVTSLILQSQWKPYCYLLSYMLYHTKAMTCGEYKGLCRCNNILYCCLWLGPLGHSISELTFQKMRQDTAVSDFEAWPFLLVISHLGKHLHHHWRTDKMQCPCQAHVKQKAMLSLLLLAFLHQPYLAFSDSAPRSRHNVASPSLWKPSILSFLKLIPGEPEPDHNRHFLCYKWEHRVQRL